MLKTFKKTEVITWSVFLGVLLYLPLGVMGLANGLALVLRELHLLIIIVFCLFSAKLFGLLLSLGSIVALQLCLTVATAESAYTELDFVAFAYGIKPLLLLLLFPLYDCESSYRARWWLKAAVILASAGFISEISLRVLTSNESVISDFIREYKGVTFSNGFGIFGAQVQLPFISAAVGGTVIGALAGLGSKRLNLVWLGVLALAYASKSFFISFFCIKYFKFFSLSFFLGVCLFYLYEPLIFQLMVEFDNSKTGYHISSLHAHLKSILTLSDLELLPHAQLGFSTAFYHSKHGLGFAPESTLVGIFLDLGMILGILTALWILFVCAACRNGSARAMVTFLIILLTSGMNSHAIICIILIFAFHVKYEPEKI